MNYLALFDVLRKGEVVADPATWKTRSAIVVALSGLLIAANHAYPQLGLDQSTADAIAGTIAFAVSLFSTFATSDKVGLLPAKPKPDSAPETPV